MASPPWASAGDDIVRATITKAVWGGCMGAPNAAHQRRGEVARGLCMQGA
jgi:hypothetical protein